jgi:hypothetical protein
MLENGLLWWNALQDTDKAIVAAIGGIVFLGGSYATGRILGKMAMRKRERERRKFEETLRQVIANGEFGQAIEDKLVCEIQKKIASGVLSLDQARMIYAHYSRLGLWGLSPRKLNIPKTGLDLTELKERLLEAAAMKHPKSKWAARWRAYIGTATVVHTEQGPVTILSVDKMLDGVKL